MTVKQSTDLMTGISAAFADHGSTAELLKRAFCCWELFVVDLASTGFRVVRV